MSESKKIVLIGAGGHGATVCDHFKSTSSYEIIGYFDNDKKTGYPWDDLQHFGSFQELENFDETNLHLHLSIGKINTGDFRQNLFLGIRNKNQPVSSLLSQQAYISSNAKIGEGTLVMPNAMITNEVVIGENCIINHGAIIEHGAQIGSHCHIGPGAVIGANSILADNVYVGHNATLHYNTALSYDSIVKPGTVI